MTAPVKQFENGLKLGRIPTPAGQEPQFKFANYLDLAALPTPPADFGHDKLVASWPMFKNDALGDCVIAGAQHQEQLYHVEAGTSINLSDDSAIKNYIAWGHYDPSDPNSDQGTDMAYAARQWQHKGLLDADGKFHKIAAYAELQPGNLNQLKAGTYLFSAIGIGIQFPNYAMDRFDRGEPWDVARRGEDTTIEGGHYIPSVGFHNGNIIVVTWGRAIQMTPAFYREYCDIAIVYFSKDMLKAGKSLEGFNTTALTSDLRSVGRLH